MANLSPRPVPPSAPAGWSTLHRHHIGVDVGGTLIKYAAVDMADGELTTPVLQRPTPVPATPDALAEQLVLIVQELAASPQAPHPEASVGVALPAIIRHGVARSAANIDDAARAARWMPEPARHDGRWLTPRPAPSRARRCGRS